MHWAPGRGGVPKTQDNQERRARLHIVPHLGELPLRNITAAELRTYIAKLESTVSSVDYQRGILSELSSILGQLSTTSGLPGTPCTRSPCGGPRRHRSDATRGRWLPRFESAISSARETESPS
ncbi:N-terminal phage integrase SAM-like domain-containing protein [Streptomyces ipomoeae]|uniref:N-terminal phage integrase SAM-like domain-containing protein n=1 Tax=Streptomyces ipomoeae TaxID=103232 RepID=UPI0029ACC1C7|nr:N-terminal phage integrase SAM-like domain-containing protein [Streptomyces ipomoeae]MDX2934758.1 N-terminal phage integrase SAM-like domain-containing protein [Streptomyces ipomoeae]